MTSKVYNKGNNRPLNTMDEIAYHELESKCKNLEEKLGAYDKQVGGAHYKDMKVQPAQFINDNKLLFAEGNAIKYICRHKHKGEVQDLEKAKHYIDMIIERDYGPQNSDMVPMTEEEEYRNAGISKEEAEKKPETWVEGYNKWKELSMKGVISNKVKLGDLKPHN
jgi:hypothetical protein